MLQDVFFGLPFYLDWIRCLKQAWGLQAGKYGRKLKNSYTVKKPFPELQPKLDGCVQVIHGAVAAWLCHSAEIADLTILVLNLMLEIKLFVGVAKISLERLVSDASKGAVHWARKICCSPCELEMIKPNAVYVDSPVWQMLTYGSGTIPKKLGLSAYLVFLYMHSRSHIRPAFL